jgi:hypothetical protein
MDENDFKISWKVYVDSKFESVEKATNIALTAAEKAVSAALVSQQREVAAQIGDRQTKQTGRGEMIGWVMAVIGSLSLIVSIVLILKK